MAKVFSDENIQNIREGALSEGFSKLRSRIKDVEIEVPTEIQEKVKVEPKYTKEDIANSMVDLYKDKIKPVKDTPYIKNLPTHDPIDRSKEKEEANTVAKRANIRALSNSLANIRNGGFAGPTTEFTPSANGDVNPGRHCGYNALVVAGTEMTLEDYEEEVNTRMEACWKGYKRKPGTVQGAKGSCVKEEETIDEATYPSDFRNPDGSKRAVAKSKKDKRDMRPQMDDEERDEYGRRKTVDESPVVDELKDKLLEMDDHTWQSIDTVMRKLAKENDMTPRELHQKFKAESNGMIPDDWAKENALKEEAGWMPLDEAVVINKVGNVYEVSLMWRAHTRRLKFFWPEVGTPSRDDMQRAVEMFYPGGKLITFYMSTLPVDNQTNFMVIVPPLKESVVLEERAWEEMTDEECGIYEYILAEEGEPTSPPMLHESGEIEVWVEDHDTGEERVIFFSEKKEKGKKDACYNKVKSRYSVWPSAYASGALVKCRQKGADNWGKSDKKEEYIPEDMSGMSQKSGDKRSTESGAGMTAKGVAKYNSRTGGNLKTAVTTPPSKLKAGSKAAGRRKSFCARSRGWNGERGKAARARWNC